MRIFHYCRQTGFLLGEDSALPSPLEPGVFLIPAFATDKVPPCPEEGEIAKFSNGDWELSPIPVEEPPELGEETAPEVEVNAPPKKDFKTRRKWSYENEADPLFFKAQRGEASMEDWRAKIEEIRARYPETEEL